MRFISLDMKACSASSTALPTGILTSAATSWLATGSADITLSDRWGVEVGAQAYHSLSSSHWEVVPIVKPYYRINKKATIGIDVGGIVYELLKSARGYSPGNPTIGPPIGH